MLVIVSCRNIVRIGGSGGLVVVGMSSVLKFGRDEETKEARGIG